MTTGHAGNSGLQRHSIGDSYPFSVVVIDNAITGQGRCEIRNLISGEIIAAVSYSNPAGFAYANEIAEQSAIALRQAADKQAATVAAVPSPRLWECMVLIPLQPTTNNFANGVYGEFRQWLASRYTGWTIGETRRGVWFDSQGVEHRDDVSPLYVACVNPAEFRESLAAWVARFGQQCLYFRGPDGEASLISAPPVEDGRHNWFGLAE